MDSAIFPVRGSSTTKARQPCCVKSCKSRTTLGGRLSFHNFPKPNRYFIKKKNEQGDIEQVDRLDAWKIALAIDKVASSKRVCSLHFRKDDYIFPDVPAAARHLKKNAVPTLFVPNDTFKSLYTNYNQCQDQSGNQTGYSEKVGVREELEFVSVKSEPYDEMLRDEDADFPRIKNNYSPVTNQKQYLESNSQNVTTQVKQCNVKTFKNVAIQVDADYSSSSLKILEFIDSDSDLNTLTGIQSLEALEAVVKSVNDECGYKYEGVSSEMKTKGRVIMTCAKMKHNLSFSFLTIMFKSCNKKISHSSCQQIYSDMVKVLYDCFKKAPANELTALTLKGLNLEKYQELSED